MPVEIIAFRINFVSSLNLVLILDHSVGKVFIAAYARGGGLDNPLWRFGIHIQIVLAFI